jgi:hypothetical protein
MKSETTLLGCGAVSWALQEKWQDARPGGSQFTRPPATFSIAEVAQPRRDLVSALRVRFAHHRVQAAFKARNGRMARALRRN